MAGVQAPRGAAEPAPAESRRARVGESLVGELTVRSCTAYQPSCTLLSCAGPLSVDTSGPVGSSGVSGLSEPLGGWHLVLRRDGHNCDLVGDLVHILATLVTHDEVRVLACRWHCSAVGYVLSACCWLCSFSPAPGPLFSPAVGPLFWLLVSWSNSRPTRRHSPNRDLRKRGLDNTSVNVRGTIKRRRLFQRQHQFLG